MLDDMEQHFDLHILIYSIPIYLFPSLKKENPIIKKYLFMKSCELTHM